MAPAARGGPRPPRRSALALLLAARLGTAAGGGRLRGARWLRIGRGCLFAGGALGLGFGPLGRLGLGGHVRLGVVVGSALALLGLLLILLALLVRRVDILQNLVDRLVVHLLRL